MRRLVTLVMSVALLVTLSAPAGAESPQYLKIGNAKKAGQPIGCVDVNWAAQQGLIEPVEVRWLNELGIQCPDATVPREGVPSNQYVVMLAMAAKGQLSCPDVEWNAAFGFLTWSAAINLAGFVPGCRMSQYANMVTLGVSGRLTCDDVTWNLGNGFITENQAGWLRGPLGGCAPSLSPDRTGCDPAYPDVCIPSRAAAGRDLDCADVPYQNFRVLEPDPHRFDEGGVPGIGCEA